MRTCSPLVKGANPYSARGTHAEESWIFSDPSGVSGPAARVAPLPPHASPPRQRSLLLLLKLAEAGGALAICRRRCCAPSST